MSQPFPPIPAGDTAHTTYVVFIPDGDLNIFGKVRMASPASVLYRYPPKTGGDYIIEQVLITSKGTTLAFTRETIESTQTCELLQGLFKLRQIPADDRSWHEIVLQDYDRLLVLVSAPAPKSRRAIDQWTYYYAIAAAPIQLHVDVSCPEIG